MRLYIEAAHITQLIAATWTALGGLMEPSQHADLVWSTTPCSHAGPTVAQAHNCVPGLGQLTSKKAMALLHPRPLHVPESFLETAPGGTRYGPDWMVKKKAHGHVSVGGHADVGDLVQRRVDALTIEGHEVVLGLYVLVTGRTAHVLDEVLLRMSPAGQLVPSNTYLDVATLYPGVPYEAAVAHLLDRVRPDLRSTCSAAYATVPEMIQQLVSRVTKGAGPQEGLMDGGYGAFEMVRFDVVLDQGSCQPWLLEVNSGPNMHPLSAQQHRQQQRIASQVAQILMAEGPRLIKQASQSPAHTERRQTTSNDDNTTEESDTTTEETPTPTPPPTPTPTPYPTPTPTPQPTPTPTTRSPTQPGDTLTPTASPTPSPTPYPTPPPTPSPTPSPTLSPTTSSPTSAPTIPPCTAPGGNVDTVQEHRQKLSAPQTVPVFSLSSEADRIAVSMADCSNPVDVSEGPDGALYLACQKAKDEYVFTVRNGRGLKLRDRAFYHYQIGLSAISIIDGLLATCQNNDNDYAGYMAPNYFMGLSLYNLSLPLIRTTGQRFNASDPLQVPYLSHIDMLHETPNCLDMVSLEVPGFDAHTSNGYLVVDGFNKQLVKVNFLSPHGPGVMDHSTARVERLYNVPITATNISLAVDTSLNITYVADPGAGHVLAVDYQTGDCDRTHHHHKVCSARTDYPVFSSDAKTFDYVICQDVVWRLFAVAPGVVSVAVHNSGVYVLTQVEGQAAVHTYARSGSHVASMSVPEGAIKLRSLSDRLMLVYGHGQRLIPLLRNSSATVQVDEATCRDTHTSSPKSHCPPLPGRSSCSAASQCMSNVCNLDVAPSGDLENVCMQVHPQPAYQKANAISTYSKTPTYRKSIAAQIQSGGYLHTYPLMSANFCDTVNETLCDQGLDFNALLLGNCWDNHCLPKHLMCLNNGTLEKLNSKGYRCRCPAGWIGDTCDTSTATQAPSSSPSSSPTSSPTPSPTPSPTSSPTASTATPSATPVATPITSQPSATPSPQPTASPSPAPPTVSSASYVEVAQDMTVASLNSPSQYSAPIKRVYEAAYGISLTIYDESSATYRAGCSVASIASTDRRAVKVSFTAVVSTRLASSARVAAVTLAGDTSIFAGSVKAAKTATGETSVAVPVVAAVGTPQVRAPQGGDSGQVQASQPVPSGDNDSEFPLVILIIVAGVVVTVLTIAFVFCRMRQSGGEPPSVDGGKMGAVSAKGADLEAQKQGA